jgi:hypothetical protein
MPHRFHDQIWLEVSRTILVDHLTEPDFSPDPITKPHWMGSDTEGNLAGFTFTDYGRFPGDLQG